MSSPGKEWRRFPTRERSHKNKRKEQSIWENWQKQRDYLHGVVGTAYAYRHGVIREDDIDRTHSWECWVLFAIASRQWNTDSSSSTKHSSIVRVMLQHTSLSQQPIFPILTLLHRHRGIASLSRHSIIFNIVNVTSHHRRTHHCCIIDSVTSHRYYRNIAKVCFTSDMPFTLLYVMLSKFSSQEEYLISQWHAILQTFHLNSLEEHYPRKRLYGQLTHRKVISSKCTVLHKHTRQSTDISTKILKGSNQKLPNPVSRAQPILHDVSNPEMNVSFESLPSISCRVFSFMFLSHKPVSWDHSKIVTITLSYEHDI